MTLLVPTLGELRKLLADEGLPPTGVEYGFDLADEAPPGYLPDSLVVSRRTCELVLDGAYDDCPDATPIEELHGE
jgi:hypothetical protein